jgi:hypothetical protein
MIDQEFAIFVVHTTNLGASVPAISHLKRYRTTLLSKNVLRFATQEGAEYYRRTSLAPRPRRRYIVSSIPPLWECGKTLPRPVGLEHMELAL